MVKNFSNNIVETSKIKNKRSIFIGIAGASASGKTLLASTIINELGSSDVVVISEDSYYKDLSHLSFEEREKINYDHPNSLDYDLLIEHLAKLKSGQEIDVPVYNYTKHCRDSDIVHIKPGSIIVLEGILLFTEKTLRDFMDIRIFVDTSLDLCLLRRIKRDILQRGRTIEYVMKQYHDNVRPMFLKFIEPSKKYAHLIVPKGGKNRVAIDVIKAKMRELLAEGEIN